MIGRVVEFILQLENQLSDRSVTIRLTDAARNELGDQGYDRLMGARPLARVIGTRSRSCSPKSCCSAVCRAEGPC